MLDEWKRDQEENHTDTSPYAIFRNSYENFDYYLDNLECDKRELTRQLNYRASWS